MNKTFIELTDSYKRMFKQIEEELNEKCLYGNMIDVDDLISIVEDLYFKLVDERENHKTEIEQMQDAEEFKKDPYGFLGISERD